ncbi:DUF1566 domain-containing protein [Aridibaculum aurantiacum]|uniref:Lcl domain-containing protein n=1 Tax=Aridibaculum aurantiacum TaxID=2810307 RepID=UPI001A968089|nr:DUF1566 domain-containing protein [Aridibaculum aurantiacum]
MRGLIAFAFLIFLLHFISSCKHEVTPAAKDGLPAVTTNTPTTVTSSSASLSGDVTNQGGSPVTERGFCWSTTTSPTIQNYTITSGQGTGSFTSSITNLAASTKYYVRAFAKNSASIAYGNEVSFTTTSASSTGVPTVSTNDVVYVAGSNTAQSGGSISADGGSAITEKGICWGTSSNPSVQDNRTIDGTGTANFNSQLTGLIAGTTYYVRAYARNSSGVGYGSNKNFTTSNNTPPSAPVVTTTAASYNAATATISTGGNVSSDGGAAVTARGVVWATSPNPVLGTNATSNGSGTGSFASSITSVAANSTYYIRAYATNSVGTTYGNSVTINTNASSTFTIGQSYGGGIIFFVDATGQHGLIAATQDVGGTSGTKWDYNSNTQLIGANSTTDGKTNTTKIITALGTSQSYAAQLCTNYSSQGFSDWFLPSRNQLSQLYQQRAVVGGFNTSSGSYWSSTEVDKNKAWIVEFSGSNGGRQEEDNKDDAHLVRPIRAF